MDEEIEEDKPSLTPMIDDANLASKRMEEATKAQKEENDRTERLQSLKKLGGSSEAGIQPEAPESEDAKWEREAKERYEGTGMDPTD